MATYQVEATDGSVWEINAPEKATKEQVLDYAKNQTGGKDVQFYSGKKFDGDPGKIIWDNPATAIVGVPLKEKSIFDSEAFCVF
jgi:hypothetical protein